jgi:hypothetical protein
MQAEYDALIQNKTWSIVSLPPHRQAIGCKWVFRVKENPDGSVNRYKARLVAKGFHQRQGFDFTETFSPVVKPATIRLILTIAITHKWSIQQLDVNNAFLNGILDEEVYMAQPQGFDNGDSSQVCKLNKALYGLKQAPRQWFERLQATLLQLGFRSSKCDPSLFIFSSQGNTIYLLVYVDDIIITSNNSTLLHSIIKQLNQAFSLKQLGDLDYFLGIEVNHLSNGSLLLTQSKYIRDLLTKTNMIDSAPVNTPMQSTCKLSKTGSPALSDPFMYRSVVGALQYATITRPELSYSVNKVCQFMSHPLEAHWTAVKRILRYLKGIIQHGLLLSPAVPSCTPTLKAFVMPIGLLIRMIGVALLVLPFILGLISFRGGLRNSRLLLDQARKLNIAALLMLLLNYFGCRHFLLSLRSHLLLLLFSVTTFLLFLLLIIPSFILAPSTWKLICFLYVRRLFPNSCVLFMFRAQISGLMPSRSLSHPQSFLNSGPNSMLLLQSPLEFVGGVLEIGLA